MSIHSSVIHNSHSTETVQCPLTDGMDKQDEYNSAIKKKLLIQELISKTSF